MVCTDPKDYNRREDAATTWITVEIRRFQSPHRRSGIIQQRFHSARTMEATSCRRYDHSGL